jgi:hypothetical protein
MVRFWEFLGIGYSFEIKSSICLLKVITPFLGKGKVGKASGSELWSERIGAVICLIIQFLNNFKPIFQST